MKIPLMSLYQVFKIQATNSVLLDGRAAEHVPESTKVTEEPSVYVRGCRILRNSKDCNHPGIFCDIRRGVHGELLVLEFLTGLTPEIAARSPGLPYFQVGHRAKFSKRGHVKS